MSHINFYCFINCPKNIFSVHLVQHEFASQTKCSYKTSKFHFQQLQFIIEN